MRMQKSLSILMVGTILVNGLAGSLHGLIHDPDVEQEQFPTRLPIVVPVIVTSFVPDSKTIFPTVEYFKKK